MKVDVVSTDEVFGLQASGHRSGLPRLRLHRSPDWLFCAASPRQRDRTWRSVACYRSGTVAGSHGIPSILRQNAKACGLLNSKNEEPNYLRQCLIPGGKHNTEPRFAAHHPLVSFCYLLNRIDFIHRSHTGENAEGECILRVNRHP
jgi:hypothetical protein